MSTPPRRDQELDFKIDKIIKTSNIALSNTKPECSTIQHKAGEKKMHRRTGFTLIELMIVVAIVAIIAAIAIPSILRSRMTANEDAAFARLRTISSAQTQFQSTGISVVGEINQYGTLDQLISTNMDWMPVSGVKQGYVFAITLGPDPKSPTFQATAIPIALNSTGHKTFFVDQTGIMRSSSSGVATASSQEVN